MEPNNFEIIETLSIGASLYRQCEVLGNFLAIDVLHCVKFPPAEKSLPQYLRAFQAAFKVNITCDDLTNPLKKMLVFFKVIAWATKSWRIKGNLFTEKLVKK